MADARAEAVSRALERLYAAPLDGFVALRKELARELKAGGGPGAAEAAREVLAAPKPSRVAWALNRVAREAPAQLEALLAARDEAAAVQGKGDAEAVHRTARAFRAQVTAVTQAARDALEAAGAGATPAQLRRIGETLAAACVEGTEARRLLVAGRLSGEVEEEDPFAGLEAGAPRAAVKPVVEPETARAAAEAERERARREEARRAAEKRVAACEGELKEAQAEAHRRRRAAARAQEEAEAAERAAGEAEERLVWAREALRALGA